MTINKEDARFINEQYQQDGVLSVKPITGFRIGEIAKLSLSIEPGTVNIVKQNPKTGNDFLVTVKIGTKLYEKTPKRVGAEDTFSGPTPMDIPAIVKFLADAEEYSNEHQDDDEEDEELDDIMGSILKTVFPWVCDDDADTPLPDCTSCDKREECHHAKSQKAPKNDDVKKPVKDFDKSSIYPDRMKTMDIKTGELHNNDTTESIGDIYLVTNVTGDGEYTPSVFTTLNAAKDWLKECTIKNFLAAVDTDDVSYEIDTTHKWGFTSAFKVPLKNDENIYKVLKDYNETEKFLWYINSDVIEGVVVEVSNNYMASTIVYKDDSFNEMHIHKISRKDGELSIENLH